MRNYNMYTLCNELEAYFAENHLYADAYPYITNHAFKDIACIAVEINWGDWKHDHWRADCLVEEFLKANGIEICLINEQVTEEDGSDCYSAIHYYKWIA